jgi:hypothetical protein
MMFVNRQNVGQVVAGQGGRLETANLRGILSAGAHLDECEQCRWSHLKMIKFASPLRVDYFSPALANEMIERVRFAMKKIEEARVAGRPLPQAVLTRRARLSGRSTKVFVASDFGPSTKERRRLRQTRGIENTADLNPEAAMSQVPREVKGQLDS